MNAYDRCCRLAEKIRDIFEKGFPLGPESVHFIDSTFLTPSVDRLRSLIQNPADSEVETLFNLIFSPDGSVQAGLENFLETHRFQRQDEPPVVDHLEKTPVTTRLSFPDRRGALELPVPGSIFAGFVSRLKIHKHLHLRLIRTIALHVPENERVGIKVRLRNARFEESDARVAFLADFFEKVTEDVRPCLDLLIDLFEERKSEPDIYGALMARKRLCYQGVQKAKRLKEMLEKDNVETLMLRGVRILFIDEADLRRQMGRIDRICLTLCGKTEYFPPVEGAVEEGTYEKVGEKDTTQGG